MASAGQEHIRDNPAQADGSAATSPNDALAQLSQTQRPFPESPFAQSPTGISAASQMEGRTAFPPPVGGFPGTTRDLLGAALQQVTGGSSVDNAKAVHTDLNPTNAATPPDAAPAPQGAPAAAHTDGEETAFVRPTIDDERIAVPAAVSAGVPTAFSTGAPLAISPLPKTDEGIKILEIDNFSEMSGVHYVRFPNEAAGGEQQDTEFVLVGVVSVSSADGTFHASINAENTPDLQIKRGTTVVEWMDEKTQQIGQIIRFGSDDAEGSVVSNVTGEDTYLWRLSGGTATTEDYMRWTRHGVIRDGAVWEPMTSVQIAEVTAQLYASDYAPGMTQQTCNYLERTAGAERVEISASVVAHPTEEATTAAKGDTIFAAATAQVPDNFLGDPEAYEAVDIGLSYEVQPQGYRSASDADIRWAEAMQAPEHSEHSLVDAALGPDASQALRREAIYTLAKELGISIKIVDAAVGALEPHLVATESAATVGSVAATEEGVPATTNNTLQSARNVYKGKLGVVRYALDNPERVKQIWIEVHKDKENDLERKGHRRENLQDLLVTLWLMSRHPTQLKDLWNEHQAFIHNHDLLDPYDSAERPVYSEVKDLLDGITLEQLGKERDHGMPAQSRRIKGAKKVTAAGALLALTAIVRHYAATRGVGADAFDGVGTAAYVVEALGAAQWNRGRHFTPSPSEDRERYANVLDRDDAAREKIQRIRS